jgi:hypothetical protein
VEALLLIEAVVEQRQAEIRHQVAMCRRRAVGGAAPAGPRAPWRVRLGWRLVELGLRLALPGPDAQARAVWPLP